MDFNDTRGEAAFRAEARAGLEATARRRTAAKRGDAAHLAAAKVWQAKKAAAGYAQIAWPKEWGGGGGTPIQSIIFAQEESKYVQNYGYFQIGLGMCLPTVMAFGEKETKQRFVGPAVRGEEIWCQLFSEPSAGSDVAGVRTRAVRDAGDWVINGQKVWTSGAHYSDFGIVLVRTNPNVPKHKGLTMFWLNLTSRGVEVRPIHQMSGGRDFNEEYFTDMRDFMFSQNMVNPLCLATSGLVRTSTMPKSL